MSGPARSRQPSAAGTPPSDSFAPPAPAVTTFGKYSLFASLGKGGMADVFLSVARGQMGFNKLAVIKRLRPALAEEVAFRTMFLDEARLAARLNHPNIVHTYEVGEHQGQYFIAMEYLEGQALNKMQKELVRTKQRLEPQIAVRMVADGLAGLGYAHDLRDYDGTPLRVIHRDVSPHNLFVTYDGHTKLVDFGIAKAASSSTETEVGILKGKVAYMSPEQAMGGAIDQRADLFAMGIVLWELLTQQRLMTGDNPANTLHRLMNEIIPHVADHAPGIDMDLDHLVARALEKDPARRFQSASEMREALDSWLSRQPRQTRQDDVARTMNNLFGNVRAEVQKQVQKQMAVFGSAQNTAELEALTQDALTRMNQRPGDGSGGLLKLGGSGSGSGVVAHYGGFDGRSSQPPPPPSGFPSFPPSGPSMQSMSGFGNANMTGPHQPIAQGGDKSNPLLLVITAGCFILAATLVAVYGFRHREQIAPTPPIASVTVVAVDPSATATTISPAATTFAVPTVIVSDPAPQPRPHTQPMPNGRLPVPAAAPAEDRGFVTLSAYPWAKVSENGKVICQTTPCNRIPLSAGTHMLTFEDGVDSSQKQTVSVQIKSGEVTPKNIGFR